MGGAGCFACLLFYRKSPGDIKYTGVTQYVHVVCYNNIIMWTVQGDRIWQMKVRKRWKGYLAYIQN